eukprot:scaffold26521_cov69-Phaeocystis_antarctica.AAC.4
MSAASGLAAEVPSSAHWCAKRRASTRMAALHRARRLCALWVEELLLCVEAVDIRDADALTLVPPSHRRVVQALIERRRELRVESEAVDATHGADARRVVGQWKA